MKIRWAFAVICVSCLLLTGCRTAETAQSEQEIKTTTCSTSTTASATQAPTSATKTTVRTSVSPQNMALKTLEYWDAVEYIEIPRTFGPPYNHTAVLEEGTEEFDTLMGLLRQVEGDYVGSAEGLYGPFGTIKLCADDKLLDTVVIGMGDGEVYFSTDTQKEPSTNPAVDTMYRSRYAMPASLAEKLQAFLRSLTYKADT